MQENTYRNVHHILTHMVLSQKNAARKKKCMPTTEHMKGK